MVSVKSTSWALSPQDNGTPTTFLALLLAYSFSSQFLPIEPYLVPYFTSVKYFGNSQVTLDIYPCSVYAQLIFTLLVAPFCLYVSHKVVIVLGSIGMLVTYIIIWYGKSLLAMRAMQTSVTTTTSLSSFMLASELGQLFALQDVPYAVFFIITLVSVGFSCIATFLLPKDPKFSNPGYPLLPTYWSQDIGWLRVFHETWRGRKLKILSLWWALSYAGFSLVQNYGTNLFDAVDSKSKLNGHVLAASQAVGGLGAFCAIYLEDLVDKSGLLTYMLGSATMGMLCVIMGSFQQIWIAYTLFVVLSGIYQTLNCLASVHCSRLLSNQQFIILFSVNNFRGLLLETAMQAVLEVIGMSIFRQFIAYSVFLFLATTVAICPCFVPSASVSSGSTMEIDSSSEELINT